MPNWQHAKKRLYAPQRQTMHTFGHIKGRAQVLVILKKEILDEIFLKTLKRSFDFIENSLISFSSNTPKSYEVTILFILLQLLLHAIDTFNADVVLVLGQVYICDVLVFSLMLFVYGFIHYTPGNDAYFYLVAEVC